MYPKQKVSLKSKKRVLFVFGVLAILMIGILFRVAWIQVVSGDELKDIAKDQQTSDIPINPKRGAIVDRNGEVMASSITCYSVWVRPAEVRLNYGKKLDEIASELAAILGMKAEDIEKTFASESPLIRMSKYLEKEEADKVTKLGISGIETAEDTRRSYPMGNFAATMLGSVKDDGTGRSGLELQYDAFLSGVSGRSVRDTDVHGNALSFGPQKLYKARDGYTLMTTCDEYLQTELDKAVRDGYKKTKSDCVIAMAMNPKTGEILAMSEAPSFDPNNPTEPRDKSAFDKLDIEGKSSYLSSMWKSTFINEIYEPGSTAKIITSSAGIEEGLVTPDTPFHCDGWIEVEGIRFYDAEHKKHGDINLTKAIGYSCNPFHMGLALRLGFDRYYKYLDLYGLRERTGIDYPGEAYPLISNPEDIGNVELASMGFGQSLAITPLQLITAESAIANNGVMMKPHFAKALLDSDGKTVAKYEPEVVRKVISNDTAKEMLSIMEDQVEKYGGRTARIPGYRIGAKTGTANRTENGKYTDDYNISFISIAPVDDPKMILLVICQAPKTSIMYPEYSAIPISKAFWEKALPYLGVEKTKTDKDGNIIEEEAPLYVPDVTSHTYREAVDILESYKIKYKLLPELTQEEKKDKDPDIKVEDQYPKAGSSIGKDETVYLYRQ
jgi:stage V sporulation protein D (sporulation-specific penicillin-binding protein)